MLDFSQAIQTIEASQNILILPSSPPDGDSIGSALAMQKALQQKGKNATVVLSSGVPEILKFLPESEGILKEVDLNPDLHITIDLREDTIKDVKHEIVDNKINIIVTPETGVIDSSQVSFPEPEKKYDLIITVDTAVLEQLGHFFQQNAQIFGQIPSINIDHHPSNANFASINLVDPSVASTTQILVDMFNQWSVQMDPDTATLLLAGIITDTGSFQNANTTPEAFDVAANLIDQGARQQEIIKHVYKTKQLQTLKLWGRILSNIQVDEANKIVWSTVTREDFAETGTVYEDIGDIIDELISNAEEAEVALLLIEKEDGTLHGSMRTTTDARNASNIAATFGGGGHVRAAGFNIPNAKINEKLPEILQAIINEGGGTPQQPAQQPVQQPTPQPQEATGVTMQATPEPTPQPEPQQPVQQQEEVELSNQETGTISGGSLTNEESGETFDIEADSTEGPQKSVDDLSRDFVSKPEDQQ